MQHLGGLPGAAEDATAERELLISCSMLPAWALPKRAEASLPIMTPAAGGAGDLPETSFRGRGAVLGVQPSSQTPGEVLSSYISDQRREGRSELGVGSVWGEGKSPFAPASLVGPCSPIGGPFRGVSSVRRNPSLFFKPGARSRWNGRHKQDVA